MDFYSEFATSDIWYCKAITKPLVVILLIIVWFKILLPSMKQAQRQQATTAIIIVTTVYYPYIILTIGTVYWLAKGLLEILFLPWGPFGMPVLGYLPWISERAPYLTFCRLADKYGSYFTIKMGGIHNLVVSDVGMIKDLYKSPKFVDRPNLYLTHGIMGNKGIIGASGENWKLNRKFSLSSMVQMGLTSLDSTRTVSEDKEKSRGAARGKMQLLMKDVYAELRRSLKPEAELSSKVVTSDQFDEMMEQSIGNMLNIIIFGIRYQEDDPLDQDGKNYRTWKRIQKLRAEGIKELSVGGGLANFVPWVASVDRKLAATVKRIKDGLRETHDEYSRVTREVKESMNIDCETPTSMTKDFLLSKMDSQIGDNALEDFHFLQGDIFGAGMDTTATSVKFVFLYLCKYPKWQEKLRQETHSEGQKCPLLWAFICEVQRLHPVVPLGVPHANTIPVRVKFSEGKVVVKEMSYLSITDLKACLLDGWRLLPKGTMVMALHWHTNRSPKVWENPLNFNPMRFINKEGHFDSSLSINLIPFQTGRRQCIGKDFAKNMIANLTKDLLTAYRFKLKDESYDLEELHEHGFTLNPNQFSLVVEEIKTC